MASTDQEVPAAPASVDNHDDGGIAKVEAATRALKIHEDTKGPGGIVPLPKPEPTTAPAPPTPAPETAPSEPTEPYEPPVDDETISEVPIYAIVYAPLLHCFEKERYWPGSVLVHLQHCHPETSDGDLIDIPADVVGKPAMLTLPEVNKDDVFLKLDVGFTINTCKWLIY